MMKKKELMVDSKTTSNGAVAKPQNACAGWLLLDIPSYDGGILSGAIYDTGPGSEKNQELGAKSEMQLVSQTSANEFLNYIKKLEADGFKREFYNTIENNIYVSLYNGVNRVYAYYTDSVAEARIIIDKTSPNLSDFSYKYNKTESDTTVLYQYGLPMALDGSDISVNGHYLNCGMMYLIKLADNSIFLIDGGGNQQFDSDLIDEFMRFLYNVTGTAEGEKIRISCWFITHAHPDHFAGVCNFFAKYHNQIELERMMFNFPTLNTNTVLNVCAASRNKLFQYIESYYGENVAVLKAHTGMEFSIADVGVEVICTHEDITDASSAETLIIKDYNDCSTVIRLTFDNKTFMMLADINKLAQNVINKNFSPSYLESDIVQVSHHTWNNLQELYSNIKAPIALFPQSSGGAIKDEIRVAISDSIKLYAKESYYAGDETVGLSVVDGKLMVSDRRPIVGGSYKGWSW